MTDGPPRLGDAGRLGQAVDNLVVNALKFTPRGGEVEVTAGHDGAAWVITVRDILTELEKPGRDPRPDFKVARFNEGVENLQDLKEGMVLEGTVSNVAAFGAFVDLGVHQDGLVHVSAMADRFISDPHEVVKSGQVVKVKVLEADEKGRIRLSMKAVLEEGAAPQA